MGDKGFFIPSELAFQLLDALRLAHVYVLKDSHPEELAEDFKPWKWSNEIEFAQRGHDAYLALLKAMEASEI